ncbi:MAG: lamin tail domain-containing protein [Candidatus Cloacimonas acidaminovorans]|nr:lamin tail domain-containing protein [Candidatus Cloacimonas acidaminovorans]
MKKLLFVFTLCILITGMAFGQRVASAVVSLRPTHIDISSSATESAVLMTLSGYSSNDARYRLYNGSNQYNCWNEDNDTWISSSTYADGPKVPGTPSSSTTFWIMFQRGNNINTAASYRDRLGPSYGSNYQTVALPTATSITTPFTLSGTYTGSTSVKNVVLGFASSTLVTAASTAIDTGIFSLSVPTGTTIDKIEVRKVDNTTLGSVTGSWSSTASNISISGSTPTITVNPATLTGFSYVLGSGPSSEKTFTVQGSNLTADINITVPTSPAQHYEISKTSGGTFSSSLTLTQSGGTVSETTIYVRLKAGLSAGDYNNETITVSSTGATSKTVTCSGTVSSPPPPSAPTATAATNVSYNTFTANWNSVSGATKYYLDVYTKSGGATDLIISEYVEGSGYNKAIELYNGTGSSIDLSNYSLKKQTNGAGDFGDELTLSGTLANNDTYVIVSNAGTPNLASNTYVDLATNSQALTFNGNDAVALYKNGVQIDVVGVVNQVSPNWGEDVTLVRKSSVTSPTTSYSTDQWNSCAKDTFTYLGSHTMDSSTSYVSGYQNKDVGNVTSYEVSGLNSGTTYYYVVRAYNDNGSSANSNEISVTTLTQPTPTITVNPESLTGFSYVFGSGPSSEQSFTISGSNLTANISIDAPADFEISKTSGESFSAEDPIVLTQSGGTVSETTIYVRLKAGLSAGNYNNEIITASSTDATSKTVTCSGTVYKSEPSNHCSNFTVAKVTPSTIKLTWTDAAKTTPDGYLIKGSAVSFDDITVPVDGTPESNSTLVRNVDQDLGSWTFTNLTENTTYYFKIYPYTNSGTNINYKTDGDIPQTFGTTLVNQHLSAGDIAVIGFQSTDPDKFAILLLKSINEGTEIKITDNGFNDTDALSINEGTITWTAPEGGLPRGTVVTFNYSSSWTVDKGSIMVTTAILLATGGDQIIVYQGQSSSPTFIYALSTTPWVTTGTISSNTSYIPTGLTNGSTCLALSSVKNCYYNYTSDSFTGTPSAALTSISSTSGWTSSSSAVTFPSWSFHIFDFPAGTSVEVNGVNVTVTGGNANIGSNDIPPIPNANAQYTGFTLVLDNTIRDWTISIQTTALFGAYYLNNMWNLGQREEENIVFNITFAKGRGEVEVPIILSDQDPTLPVELSAFTANINSQGGITVMWVTQSETGVNGYYVNRATVNNLSAAVRISPLIQASNTSQQQVYVYNDNELYEPGTYYYWLEIQDIDGVVSYYGSRSVTFGGSGNNGTPEIPLVTGIRSIYPNPFNPSATIMYELDQPANVNIEIYNNRGQIVRSFNLGQQEKNRYKLLWDGTDNSGSACGTGIYFIKMQAGKETFVKKAALVK